MRRYAVAVALAVVFLPAALDADNAFYRVLAAKPNATFEDAVQAFFELAAERSPRGMDFERQSRTLIDAKVIRDEWTQQPQAKLTRGRAAYMVCQACGIRGGVTMTIFGPSERYAFRECAYLGLWSGGNQNDYMTGGELVGVLKWAADYVDGHGGRKVKPAGPAESTPREPRGAAKEPPAPTETKPVLPPPAAPAPEKKTDSPAKK